MTIIVKDRGWNAMIKRIAGDVCTKVGYPTEMSESYDNGTEVLQVAAIHEFGTMDIPIRAHVRPAYDENKEKISSFSAKQLGKVIDGEQTAIEGIKKVGEYHTGQIKKKIKDGPFKPLAPQTIARKKSDKPLIDTGQMIQSVQHVEEHL